jgi:DNA-binding GntR family transcriptional regulator
MKQRLPSLAATRSTTDVVADALREAIRRGDFAQGQELAQVALAEQFGVSRIPLREAMRRLEAEGLIAFHANRGAVITRLSPEGVREIYETRILLEGALIERAVKNLDAFALQELNQIHSALGEERDRQRQSELNHAFHAAIYAKANRPRQLALVESLRNLVERYHNVGASLMKYTPACQRDHGEILASCRRKDPARAKRAVIRHLENALKVALANL